jgi:hypothetical protein
MPSPSRRSPALCRLDATRARGDTRQWVQDRRARTRQLIELGGLVQKAGLVELVDDDRATLLGAFLELAARLQPDEHQQETARRSDAALAPARIARLEVDREMSAQGTSPSAPQTAV